ncbi:MAG: CPBP family intramembrane metalloprotease [Chloroflexi bacterium]|nr:CPBP family intramembrane metalloprotease [Chloroflexota bacterium]
MLAFEIVAYQFLALGVASVAGWLILMRYRLSPAALGFRFPGWRSLGNAVAVVPVVLVAVSILVAIFNTLLPAYHVQGNSQELLPSGHPHIGVGTEILVLVWAAVEVPLVEEPLFRGVLFQGLRNSFGRLLPPAWGLFVAALASGLIFGLAHLEPHTLPILALLGVALAYVFQAARSLYASAVVHGLINALSVVVVFHAL